MKNIPDHEMEVLMEIAKPLEMSTSGRSISKNTNSVYYRNKEGKLHREDGPAIERIYGNDLYYLNGRNKSFEEWRDWLVNESDFDEKVITRIILENS
jgi:hypothetical protein